MPVDAAVINTGSPGGVSAIPGGWRTVAIGGGIVLALIAVVLQRGSAGSTGAAAPAGGLSTSANVALGQVAYEQRTAADEAKTRDAEMSGQLAKLSDLSNGAFASLWEQGQSGQRLQVQYGQALIGEAHEIRTEVGTDINPAAGQFYRDQQTAFGDYLQGGTDRLMNGLSAPPPWTTSAAAASGPLATEDAADEPGVAVA